jgi:hypothetical protein
MAVVSDVLNLGAINVPGVEPIIVLSTAVVHDVLNLGVTKVL